MVSAYLTNLITRRNNIAAELAAMDSTKAGGKPSVKNQDGGTSVDHVQYHLSLMEALKQVNDEIARAQTIDDLADGAEYTFEFSTILET